MRVNRWLAIALLLTAWLLLQARLDSIPPGFQHDQTFDSGNALQIVGGDFPIYFPDNFGLDPGFMYAAAVIFKLIGGHYVWGLRFTGTLFAMLGLAVSLAFVRRYLRPKPALLAIALTAGSYWFLFAGRLGLEPVALLPTAVACFYFMLRAQERPRLGAYAIAGVLGGLAVYTYLASRTLFALPLLLLAYEAAVAAWARLRRRTISADLRTRVAGLLISLFAMLLVSAPLILYLATHANQADQRIGELGGPVSAALARGEWLPLLQHLAETPRVLLWDGAPWLLYHYNLPGRAVLQPVWAVFFVVGFLLLLVRLGGRKEFLLLVTLLLGLGPTLLTSTDAIFMRSIYALPLLYIVSVRGAVAAVDFVRWQARSWDSTAHTRWSRAAGAAVAVIVVALLAWQVADNARAYFGEWATNAKTQRIYNADFRLAAAYLDEDAGQAELFIGTDRDLALDSETYTRYEPRRADVNWFRLPGNPPLPAQAEGIYLGPTTAEIPPALELMLASGARQDLLRDALGRPMMWVVRVTPEVVARAALDAKLRPVDPPVTYDSTLRLDEVGWRDESREGKLITRWTALGPWPRSAEPGFPLLQPKAGLSITDASGYRWASADVPALLPVHTARPGEPLLEATPFALPADMPPGSYLVNLALYDDKAGALATSRGAGPLGQTATAVATIEVPLRPIADAPAAPFGVEASGEVSLRPKGKWEEWKRLLAGAPATLHVSWQSEKDLETGGLSFRTAAYDEQGTLLWQQVEPAPDLGGKWEAGRTLRLTHTARPEEGPQGTAVVRLSVCAEQGGGVLGCASEDRVEVVSQPPVMALPQPPQHPVDAQFGEWLGLAGYDLDRTGDEWLVTLYWNVESAPPVALKRFVHLLGPANSILAQSDVSLTNNGLPASSWRTGEYVRDVVRIPMQAGQDVSKVCAGLYDAGTEERLAIRGSDGEAIPDGRLCFSADALPLSGSSK